MADSDRLKLSADLTYPASGSEDSPGPALISEARRRFRPFRREVGGGFRLGEDLRISRVDLCAEREDLRRLVVIEALSPAGEAFLREWEPQLVASMRALADWAACEDEVETWPAERAVEPPPELY